MPRFEASLLALFLVSLAHCAKSDRPSGFDPGDGGADPSPSPSPAFDASFGEGGLPGAAAGCSGDLRSIIDAQGRIVHTCADNEGCRDNACVPACDAAAASQGYLGCDFLVPTPSILSYEKLGCFAVFVANGWSSPAHVTVARMGTSYDVTRFGRIPNDSKDASTWASLGPDGIPAGKVGVFFLAGDAGTGEFDVPCPAPSAVAGSSAVSTTADAARGAAFHLRADVPISAYDMYPFGGAKSKLPSAELLAPTSAWGTSYVAVLPPASGGFDSQWSQVVASADDTTVSVLPTVAIPGGPDVASAPANTVTTYRLAAGEYLEWQKTGEMTGSVVKSDKPVLFVGGQRNLSLVSATNSGSCCVDSAHAAIAPVSRLGFEYVGAPFATRRSDLQEESIVYRVVGTTAGTTLTYDPSVAGAPAAVGLGSFVDFEAVGAFRVKSQDKDHPFYLVQLMGGSQVKSGSRAGVDPSFDPGGFVPGFGDPDALGVLSPAQFLSKYVFYADVTYATTSLVVTRAKTASGFRDVTIDCLGPIAGFRAVGSGDYEVANVDLIRAFQAQGSCRNGPHVATSDGPFGLTVWGLDWFASYSYPAGGNLRTLNAVDVPIVPR